MCAMCAWYRILKFLREGKVPVDEYKVKCEDISLLRVQIYHVVSNREAVYMSIRLPITASGYEQKALVAPSADTSPGTLAAKWSRCKEGMARVFAVMAGFKVRYTSVAVGG